MVPSCSIRALRLLCLLTCASTLTVSVGCEMGKHYRGEDGEFIWIVEDAARVAHFPDIPLQCAGATLMVDVTFEAEKWGGAWQGGELQDDHFELWGNDYEGMWVRLEEEPCDDGFLVDHGTVEGTRDGSTVTGTLTLSYVENDENYDGHDHATEWTCHRY